MDTGRLTYHVEAIQQSAYRAAGMMPPVIGRFAFQRMFWTAVSRPFVFERSLANKLLASVVAMTMAGMYRARPPVSRHEIPNHYAFLMSHVERLSRIIVAKWDRIDFLYRAHDVSLAPLDISRLLVATIPSAAPNAYVRRIPSDEHRRLIVFFNVSIIPIICAVARFVSGTSDVSDRDASLAVDINLDRATQHILECSEDFRYLHDALRGTVYGDMSLLWSCAPRPRLPHGRLHQMYCDAMTTYIVAHEVGHIMLGHLTDGPAPKKSWFHQSNTYTLMQSQEIDADVFALLMNTFVQTEVAVEARYEWSQALFEASAITAFAAQDLLLRLYWMVEGVCVNLCGEEVKKSRLVEYPPYGNRLAILKRFALQLVPQEENRLSQIADMHSKLLHKVGNWVVAYNRTAEPTRGVAPGLRAAFGIGRNEAAPIQP